MAEPVQVEFRVRVPAGTPESDPVCISGNLPELGAWDGSGVRAIRDLSTGDYVARVMLPRGASVEYKVTRGGWDRVEKSADGAEIENRRFTASAPMVITIEVAGWASAAGGPKRSTASGDLRVHEGFESKILKNRRRITVWLPPGYDDDPTARYPVLYMHDGQNVFDDATSFAGEWRADETAAKLIADGRIEPLIIVAVDNAGVLRMAEYSPTPDSRLKMGGRAGAYARFLIDELKPFIDATYRTMPDARSTSTAGSSMGGLVSLYLVRDHGDIFGAAAAVSPSLWWNQRKYLDDLVSDLSWSEGKKIWIDMGTEERAEDVSGEVVHDTRRLAEALEKAGRQRGRDFEYFEVQGGRHNEQDWAARFDRILLFLFGD